MDAGLGAHDLASSASICRNQLFRTHSCTPNPHCRDVYGCVPPPPPPPVCPRPTRSLMPDASHSFEPRRRRTAVSWDTIPIYVCVGTSLTADPCARRRGHPNISGLRADTRSRARAHVAPAPRRLRRRCDYAAIVHPPPPHSPGARGDSTSAHRRRAGTKKTPLRPSAAAPCQKVGKGYPPSLLASASLPRAARPCRSNTNSPPLCRAHTIYLCVTRSGP